MDSITHVYLQFNYLICLLENMHFYYHRSNATLMGICLQEELTGGRGEQWFAAIC
jgi:hypothetical protein